MPRYMISFYDGDMNFPEEEFEAVAAASHAVVAQAKAAGVWIFGGGFMGFDVTIVDVDGQILPSPAWGSQKHIGGFSVIEVDSYEQALVWGQRIAAGCRCAQEVREFMPGSVV